MTSECKSVPAEPRGFQSVWVERCAGSLPCSLPSLTDYVQVTTSALSITVVI